MKRYSKLLALGLAMMLAAVPAMTAFAETEEVTWQQEEQTPEEVPEEEAPEAEAPEEEAPEAGATEEEAPEAEATEEEAPEAEAPVSTPSDAEEPEEGEEFAGDVLAGGLEPTEEVSYLYPVYNTEGVASSGIKEWKTGEIGGTGEIDYTEVEDSENVVAWNAGWYVVDGTVELSQGAVCNGAVRLILKDGCSLTVASVSQAGICVSGSANSLTVYGQSAGTGVLYVTGGSDSAGIGGGSNQGGSNITVNGGTVTAYGGDCGAGIGGGWQGTYSAGDSIIINGGTVTAQGGNGGSGIGGGACRGGYNILINGGTVTAEGGQAAAMYQPGAGIGNGGKTAGEGAILCGSGEIRISTSLTVKAGTDESSASEIPNDGSDLKTVLNEQPYANIQPFEKIDYLKWNSTANELEPAYIGWDSGVGYSLVEASDDAVTWNAGWYVVDSDIVINKTVTCSGDVHLILMDGYTLTVNGSASNAGILVTSGNSFTIYGQSGQNGKLIAKGTNGGAGIGGGWSSGVDAGSITINGGTVIAGSASNASGIGGGKDGTVEKVTINGGTVNSTGGTYNGAGIGGFGSTGSITITGGKVTATGGNIAGGAGIGGGKNYAGPSITITGGNITAAGGPGSDGIGAGTGAASLPVIKVAAVNEIKAGTGADSSTVIAKDRSDDTDIASELHGKQYATVEKAEAPDPEPDPASDSEQTEEPKPSFTGTQENGTAGNAENPVTDGRWNCGPDGSWTFRTNGLFRDTWGYIRLENGRTGWFWFDKNGVMGTGWQQVNGKWYYFNEVHDGTFGMMLSDTTTPDGYRVGADGAWVK